MNETSTARKRALSNSKERWKSALLPIDCTLSDAILNLDRSALQIALIVSPDGSLIGTLTDGDIRRGLLRGLMMTSPIESIVVRTPLVAPPELGRETVLNLMRVNRIHQMPVVEESRKVIGLHLWDESPCLK